MSRTGEIVLGVISAIFSVISIISLSLLVIGGSATFQEAEFSNILEQEILNDPTLAEDPEVIAQGVDTFINLFTVLGWGFVTLIVISLVLNIVGIVFISKNKKAKLAGIMFILAGVFAGILSPTSILLYIAAILCFVRKPPVQLEEEYYSPEQTL
ncbi:DUF4064 domain-containing protein [Psychrobacillus sp. FSL H8-0483]|uniref:DUF4064 domain-containing protein n=1 Tax=Psychrobacillus sp. FSL H8-0483 TaxID=2921389 RepID=UPI00315A5819